MTSHGVASPADLSESMAHRARHSLSPSPSLAEKPLPDTPQEGFGSPMTPRGCKSLSAWDASIKIAPKFLHVGFKRSLSPHALESALPPRKRVKISHDTSERPIIMQPMVSQERKADLPSPTPTTDPQNALVIRLKRPLPPAARETTLPPAKVIKLFSQDSPRGLAHRFRNEPPVELPRMASKHPMTLRVRKPKPPHPHSQITALNMIQSPFLRLPGEIRNQIYKYVLGGNLVYAGHPSKAFMDRYLENEAAIKAARTGKPVQAVRISKNRRPTTSATSYKVNSRFKTAHPSMPRNLGFRINKCYSWKAPFSAHYLALTLVSHQVNHETRLLPFSMNSFGEAEKPTHGLRNLIYALDAEQCQAIRTVHMQDWMLDADYGHLKTMGIKRKKSMKLLTGLETVRVMVAKANMAEFVGATELESVKYLCHQVEKYAQKKDVEIIFELSHYLGYQDKCIAFAKRTAKGRWIKHVQFEEDLTQYVDDTVKNYETRRQRRERLMNEAKAREPIEEGELIEGREQTEAVDHAQETDSIKEAEAEPVQDAEVEDVQEMDSVQEDITTAEV
ncbi:hypothetical protein CC80DRAFT_585947 [Byssothecium circinans]|uniref:Uncharacterized protein n=1 Tax=Byssothecium circinans TaxID=147558 RepID=A0A6A5U2R4_9PLEO|nr:hypothetical protein CC80DRAFT_585947 [Byssothecium circinans]